MKKPILTFFGEYRFLSNFWIAPFEWEGILWLSSEQAYQAAKVLDRAKWLEFAQMTPTQAKHAGKTVERRPDWDQVKVGIMLDIVREKFLQNPDLASKLLDTGDARLEEGNTWGDGVWGICPPGSSRGRNELGKILMQVRQELYVFYMD